MTHVGLEPFSAPELPESPDPVAASAAHYATEVVQLLSQLLLDLVRVRAPEVEPVLRGERAPAGLSPDLLARTLQVQGIWFQLLSIAEQNAAMRRRRQIEAERGYEQLRGTFAQVISAAAAAKVPASELRDLLEILRVRPVITAHPTEAKRVTVLEKHRKIYRRLVDLESPRWTPRERQRLVDGLRNEIELLWMTGELRLTKPTVPQEVFWGLHFFNETLFEAVPDLLDKVERVLAQYYPSERWTVPPFFQFGSWVGGDRDGNPFVTNDVTRSTLLENRLTVLRRYRRRLDDLMRTLSITEKALPISEKFRQALDKELAETGEAEAIATRNPGEVFRQYLSCMLRRLDVMILATEAGDTRPGPKGYASADALIGDLKLIEGDLIAASRPETAATVVLPVSGRDAEMRSPSNQLEITPMECVGRRVPLGAGPGCRRPRSPGSLRRGAAACRRRYWRKTSPGFRAAIASASPVAASSLSRAWAKLLADGERLLGDAERAHQVVEPATVATENGQPVLQQGAASEMPFVTNGFPSRSPPTRGAKLKERRDRPALGGTATG